MKYVGLQQLRVLGGVSGGRLTTCPLSSASSEVGVRSVLGFELQKLGDVKLGWGTTLHKDNEQEVTTGLFLLKQGDLNS